MDKFVPTPTPKPKPKWKVAKNRPWVGTVFWAIILLILFFMIGGGGNSEMDAFQYYRGR